jgi:hypothetical protein
MTQTLTEIVQNAFNTHEDKIYDICVVMPSIRKINETFHCHLVWRCKQPLVDVPDEETVETTLDGRDVIANFVRIDNEYSDVDWAHEKFKMKRLASPVSDNIDLSELTSYFDEIHITPQELEDLITNDDGESLIPLVMISAPTTEITYMAEQLTGVYKDGKMPDNIPSSLGSAIRETMEENRPDNAIKLIMDSHVDFTIDGMSLTDRFYHITHLVAEDSTYPITIVPQINTDPGATEDWGQPIHTDEFTANLEDTPVGKLNLADELARIDINDLFYSDKLYPETPPWSTDNFLAE